jgi:hypothetical protein
MSKLSGFFDEKLIVPRDFAVSKPQSIRDLGSGSDDMGQAVVSASTDVLRTSYRVDYSDPTNFVFFNSALNYFNITGEKIINEYPTTGSLLDVLHFNSGCDDYQRWVIENSWPATLGDNSGSWGYARDPNQLLNPGTASFTIEFLAYMNNGITGTFVQKMGPSAPAYSIWADKTGGVGKIHFTVSGTSGSAAISMSFGTSEASASTDVKRYLSFVCDRDLNEIRIIHAPDVSVVEENRYVSGFITTYHTSTIVVASASISNIGSVVANSGTGSVFLINSGTYGRNSTHATTNISFWSKSRTLEDVRTSYANSIRAQDDLVLLYRFNEVVNESGGTYLIKDAAGNSLDLHLSTAPRITSFTGTMGDTGVSQCKLSLSSYVPEPITIFGQIGILSNSLENYVATTQAAAFSYDKSNTNIITNLVPTAYIDLEEQVGTEVLKRFLYIIARQFDQVKVAIDQFVYWNTANYTGFNETPDALLQEAAHYYGWDFVGNFLNHDAIKYFFGKNVVPGVELDTKLYQIKNEFWRRSLNELMHIYKTKGTRESVEALMRVYGVDQKLIKLKEYGVKPISGIQTNRINSHKSVPAFVSRDGKIDYIASMAAVGFVNGFTVSIHGKFDPFTSGITGTMFQFGEYELRYYGAGTTGTLKLVNASTQTTAAFGAVPLMDGRWWSIFASLPSTDSSGSSWLPYVAAQRLDEDTVTDRFFYTGSLISGSVIGTVTVGHPGGWGDGASYINEVKLYGGYQLSTSERDAQTLDFQSYGTTDVDDLTGSLKLHWRLDDDITLPGNTTSLVGAVYDYSGNYRSGTVFISASSQPYSPYQRFLFDYNFIAPVEFGWTEEKIRVYDGSEIEPGDHFNETNAVALEFNLVDALNEDISKMLATMENWNNIIGAPANKFRETYPDLQKYRNYYFKKLEGRINFREFADILEFFDRTFVKMIQRLLPARAVFYGEEFVVESHMLERPKVQWAYRRYNPELVPEGIITMIDHSGSDSTVPVNTLNYA